MACPFSVMYFRIPQTGRDACGITAAERHSKTSV
jgi:hypothetical protein